jgi:hypothetical protein
MFAKTRRNSRRGFSTLEFAFAIPIVLAVLLGLTDITALIQGRTALQEGVRQGIRCVAAVDGKCISTRGASSTPLFHWFQVAHTQSFITDRLDHRGHGYWLQQPTYRYATARVLDSVHYAVPTTDYAATRWVYPASRTVRATLRESGGAFITGTSPTNPSFVYRHAREVPYASEFTLSHEFNEELSPARASVSLIAPFALPTTMAPCYRSNQLDRGPLATHLPGSSPCDSSRIPTIIFVRGAARGHGVGQLRLSIAGRHLDNSDFGGQRFSVDSSSWRSRNFIPRGVTPGYVSSAFDMEPEYALYAGTILLEPGENVTVTVSIAPGALNWTDPAMRYRVTEVRLIPAITRQIDTAVACPHGIPRSDYLAGNLTCALPFPAPVLGPTEVNTAINLDSSSPQSLSGIVSPAHATEVLTERGLRPLDYTLLPTSSSLEQRTAPCGPNYGVSAPSNGAGFITTAEAAPLCPVVDPQLGRFGITPHSLRWSEKTVALPSEARVTWTKESCSHIEPLPSALLAYAKAIRETTHRDFFPPPPQTPLDTDFACAEFPLEHQVYDDEAQGGTVQLPEHSLFLGFHPEQTEGCLREALHHEALTLGGLPPQAHFTVETRRVDTIYLPSSPTNSCTVFRPGGGAAGERVRLTTTGPLPSGERPPECATAPCVSELAGFATPPPAAPTADTIQAAAYWGYQEVRSLYPRAQWGCSGTECVTLEIEDGPAEVVGHGTLAVPLRTLLGGAVTLKYTDVGMKEGGSLR